MVALAGLLNALKLVGRNHWPKSSWSLTAPGPRPSPRPNSCIEAGAKNIVVCDTKGAIYRGRAEGMNFIKHELAEITNPDRQKGSLAEVIKGAEVFIGLSGAKVLTGRW